MTKYDDQEALLSGVLDEDGHRLTLRVYFEDTDFSGVVYHARYLHFLERGRTDFLRLKGVHHRALGEGAFGKPLYFVVKSMSVDFAGAAVIDDILTIKTRLTGKTGVRLIMEQTVMRDDETLITAEVTALLIDSEKRPARLPEAIAQALFSR
ncbi:MAG: YbgC/FadM family acyl-CoA thioesterase [Pseudomonadota bacterium]